MSIQIESIPSVVPDWFSPDVPDFKPPNSWAGAVVRIKVSVTSSDPAKEMASARIVLEKKYPGAVLHLVQDVDVSYPASDPGAAKSDEDMLRAYFATVQMPEGVTVDQVVAYLKTVLPDTGLFGVQGVTFGHTAVINTLCFEHAAIDMTRKGLTLVTGTRTDKDGKSNGCIAAGTYIDCPRDMSKFPKGIPIEDLVGQRPYVYGYDVELGRIVLRRASWVKKTGSKVPVVRVKFNELWGDPTIAVRKNYRTQKKRGRRISPFTELILTPEHLVMLRNGTYKRADSLLPGDRVMPLYRRNLGGKDWGLNLADGSPNHGRMPKGVKHIPNTVEIESRFILSELKGPHDNTYHAHHKDEEHLNNVVDNLEWKTVQQHTSDHLRKRNLEGTTGWQKYGIHPRGMAGKHHTDDIRKIIGESAKAAWTPKRRRAQARTLRDKKNHRIVSVTDAGFADVYDIHVPKIHNFVANSVVVHNSGKSSWVGLPFLALTGMTLKRQEHDEWAMRSNALPAEVDSTVSLPGVREMRVLRRRRPQSLRVWVDGAEQTMATPAQTQKHIERLTNLTWEVITNAVYIGQHETASAFGTDKERKELFSVLLGLNRFLDAQAKIRKASTKLQREADALMADVAYADSGLIEASHGRAELVHSLRSALKVDKSEVARLTKEAVLLNRRIEGCAAIRAKFDAEYRALTKEMREHENKASVAHGEHNALRRQRDESSQAKGACRLCGGDIAADKLAAYQAELKRSLDVLDKAIKKHGDDATAARARCSSVNNDIRLVDDEVTAANRKLESVNWRLAQIESEAASADGVKRALAAKDARIREWRKVKAIHEGARAATLDERRFVDLCAAACGRDGMPAFLCAASVPRLNAASAVYREAFESDVSVTFKAEADGVGIEVVNEDGGACMKDQSKGESSLAGIITALAFREALVPLGVLVMDEPGEGLDQQSAEAFARGMNRVASRFSSAYVISHNANILGALEPDHHVEVVKTGKVSTVREVV